MTLRESTLSLVRALAFLQPERDNSADLRKFTKPEFPSLSSPPTFFKKISLFIYLFIFGCVGSSLL